MFMATVKYDKLTEKCGGERHLAAAIVLLMFMLITYFHLRQESVFL